MIASIILAAGLSSRMGRFKPLLPYGGKTVIAQIVSVLKKAGLAEIIVVTGFNRTALEAELGNLGVRAV